MSSESIIFVSETYDIKDNIYFNDGTKTTGLTIGTGVSCTVENNEYLKITKSYNGEAYVTFPPRFNNSDNFVIEWELAKNGTFQDIGAFLYNATTANGLWICYEGGHFVGGLRGSSIPVYTTSFNVGDKFKNQQLNGVISIYKNNELVYSKTTSFSSNNYQFGNYTNSGRIQYLKNITVKPL